MDAVAEFGVIEGGAEEVEVFSEEGNGHGVANELDVVGERSRVVLSDDDLGAVVMGVEMDGCFSHAAILHNGNHGDHFLKELKRLAGHKGVGWGRCGRRR